MLPVNFLVVRHGESVGNLAKRMSEGGDNSLLQRLRKTHTAHWPLTKKGREQAKKTGEFLNTMISEQDLHFDRMYVSSYARAMMTAGGLCLADASWLIDTRITERDWGTFDRYTDEERREQFGEVLDMRDVEPFFWAPPEGETFNNLIIRIRDFIASVARINLENVIVVCHGEVMKAFRIVFMQMTPWDYAKMEFSKESLDRVHNCQIDHYSRRDPSTHQLMDRLEWFQVYRPFEVDDGTPVIPWKKLNRRRFGSDDLLAVAGKLSEEFKGLGV